MLRLKRWIAVLLAVCIWISSVPVYAFAQETELTGNLTEAETPSPSGEGELGAPSEGEEENPAPSDAPSDSSSDDPADEPLVDPSDEPADITSDAPVDLPADTPEDDPAEALPDVPSPDGENTPATIEGTGETNIVAGNAMLLVAPSEDGDMVNPDYFLTYSFYDAFNRVLEDNGILGALTKDGDTVTLTVSDGNGKILRLLSKCNSYQEAGDNYQNWIIRFTQTTGLLSLPEGFAGLGTDAFPFAGKWNASGISIKSSTTIFNALRAETEFSSVSISWEGPHDQPILAKKLIAHSADCSINIPLASALNFSPYIGEMVGGDGVVTLPALDYSGANNATAAYTGDMGIVCRTMLEDAKLRITTLSLPADLTLELTGTGSVGSLVGSMAENTELETGTISPLKLILNSSQNVGGLVGSMAAGAKLVLAQNVAVDGSLGDQNARNAGGLVGSMTNALIELGGFTASVQAEVKAAAAGGIAGSMQTENGPLTDAAGAGQISLQAVAVTATGTSDSSGVLYGVCTVTGSFAPLDKVCFSAADERSVAGPGYSGGLFGTLHLNGKGLCTISGTAENRIAIASVLSAAANTTHFGGVAGKLTGETRANALVVDNCEITAVIQVPNATTNYPKYLGGVVAMQQATLDAKNSLVNIENPKTISAGNRGFGGLSAYVDSGALLIADTMTVKNNDYSLNPGGGSVAGSTHAGSIVYLKHSLDISECPLTTNAYSGQIVGSQDASLIYAPGVAISRLQNGTYTGMELDDIGNYGEMYRIAGLLVDNSTEAERYKIELAPQLGKAGDGAYVLTTPLDYARLALAWQSRGAFDTISGSWSELKNCTIRLGDHLDMRGCGIGGLTRDVYSADDTFSGVFDGNGKTLILAIGEKNTVNDVPKGDGRVYGHNSVGLFAALSPNAKAKDLALAGNVRASVADNAGFVGAMQVGALAANLYGSASGSASVVQNLSVTTKFDTATNGSNVLYVGGIFGLVRSTSATIDLSGSELKAEFAVNNSIKAQNTMDIGGAIGAVSNDANISITLGKDAEAKSTTLGGKIEYQTNAATSHIYAGGIVGAILPRNGGSRTIRIDSLLVDGLSISAGATQRMGGILGGIWADTNVFVDGLTVSNATLSASGKAAVGGLVCTASGTWKITSADMSGLTIQAPNAQALGLMVCRGGPNAESVNGASNSLGGLYLEMAEHWEWSDSKGYSVPNVESLAGSAVFDEFVAYTECASGITANGCGVISLKTKKEGEAPLKVNMREGSRNTYQNRTAIGLTKQTNPHSRYYYNLSDVKEGCNGGTIDTAGELLIWSVYRYAASNIQSNFIEASKVQSGLKKIGGTSGSHASFDMDGLSYYPIAIADDDYEVHYADVIFYNEEIEAKETALGDENKPTRGNNSSHSQHYMMHCGLFLDFEVGSSINAAKTLTVTGTSFAGTVGIVNGGSGALLCGAVHGDSQGGMTAVANVVLAGADDEDEAVVLNGLSVVGEGKDSYAPVLINKIGAYTKLKANHVTTSAAQSGRRAGTSLIGDVGGQGATNVNLEFSGTIKLPDQRADGVFTKATLLNTLRYDSGSATYHFNKEKDYPSEGVFAHHATHGWELTHTLEYEGNQGRYEDVDEPVSADGNSDFSGYLPYVAYSPATRDSEHTLANAWHEIAVNVRSANLEEGCGTYGHPYIINDADMLRSVANYINSGTPSSGWRIRVPTDSAAYHAANGTNDILLVYEAGAWKMPDPVAPENLIDYDGDVREHFRKAYYVLAGDLKLSDFAGLGAVSDWAFMGVIDGDGHTVTLSGNSPAFVRYSYGCVIRDLTIELNQTPSLTWERKKGEQAPNAFFGGAIGCVMGGDNLIDKVTIKKGANFAIAVKGADGAVTAEGARLTPMGSYVGVIAGGGVIFRTHISTEITAGTALHATPSIYHNEIIGRVLGGYAFCEGMAAPANGDGYKINVLSEEETPDLTWNDSGKALTINNAQGLLVLSGIISSGAGSTASNAYAKGRARNAGYDQIGAADVPADYAIAKADDGAVWQNGQTPYLLKKYAGYTGNASICGASVAMSFASDQTFDMAGYGNGYRALSARYVSNAAFSSAGVAAPGVVLQVSSFNGNNTVVQNISMPVKEYDDDDFHAASVGGVFNIVWTDNPNSGVAGGVFAENVTITDCNISLQYINSSGNPVHQSKLATLGDADGRSDVTVGGFIGSVSDMASRDVNSKTSNYILRNIHVSKSESAGNRCVIMGPNSAGGIVGATAMTNEFLIGYPGILLSNKSATQFGPSFVNCTYSGTNVTGKLAAGGLAGYVYANSSVPNFSSLGITSKGTTGEGLYASCTVTEDLVVGSDSTICGEVKQSVAGGLFGAVGMRLRVNDPEVENKTGLDIFADASEMKTLRLERVEVKTSQVNTTVQYAGGSNNGPSGESAVGGIIGRIGNVNQTFFYNISLNGCTLSTGSLTGSEFAGGIVGYGYTNTGITIKDCEIVNTGMDSKYTGGFVGYGFKTNNQNMNDTVNNFNLNMRDCRIEGSTVNGSLYAGGVVGNASGRYNLFNILIKNTSITRNHVKHSQTGRLFGYMKINDTSNDFWLFASGISVYADPNYRDAGGNPVSIIIPDSDGYKESGKDYVGYISYADYAGTEDATTGADAPYVTSTPYFDLSLADGTAKRLTGDAVGKLSGDTYGSVAARAWADQKDGAADKKNAAAYQRAGTIVNGENKQEPVISTFYAQQNCGPADLPVLILRRADPREIEDYLNVITNGGFAEAEKTNQTRAVMTLTAKVYYLNEEGKFYEASDAQLASEPAAVYVSGNKLYVRSRCFDNTRKRFTLVEATFTTEVSGEACTYTVSVPVILRRELHYNFLATFSYGVEFNADSYKNLKTHLLESTAEPFSLYVTYQYNRDGSNFAEYDWQSYMDDGGSMLDVDKVLNFVTVLPSLPSLPDGTEITLVDPQNGGQAYRYTTSGASTNEVKLGRFTSVCNDGVRFESSMAEILGVQAEPSNEGKYVVTTRADATVRLKNADGSYVYYRLATESDMGDRYALTVPDLAALSSPPEENYYLVITIPEQNEDFFINGRVTTTLDWSMPSTGTMLHRHNYSSVNVGNNDETTYQISAGYQQSLKPVSEVERFIDLNEADKHIEMQVKDTITFSNRQEYGSSDSLYLKFTALLQDQAGSGVQFPAEGVKGTVRFYIQDQSGNYIVKRGSSWIRQTAQEVAASYGWKSSGDNADLPLSADGIHPLDLAGVRTLVKSGDTGNSSFSVTAEMVFEFDSKEILEMTVPGSDQAGVDSHVKLQYTSQISTQESSLNYSSARAMAEDYGRYYVNMSYQAVLSMDATKIDQLGVNPLQLVPEYQEGSDSRIDLKALLNISGLKDIKDTLKNTESITFTLSLRHRSNDANSEYVSAENPANYIRFDTPKGPGWSWTIDRSEYYDAVNDTLITDGVFNGESFSMDLKAYVSTVQKNFANYKIELTVRFNDGSAEGLSIPVNADNAHVVYTYACINPTFYDPTKPE